MVLDCNFNMYRAVNKVIHSDSEGEQRVTKKRKRVRSEYHC